MMWEELVSDDITKYWRETGFEPSDALKAYLIYDSCLYIRQRWEAFKELLPCIRDDVLRGQIEAVLSDEEESCKEIQRNDGSYIYELTLFENGAENEGNKTGYFKDFDSAVHYAQLYIDQYLKDDPRYRGLYSYSITRMSIYLEKKASLDDYNDSWDTIYFDHNDEIIRVTDVVYKITEKFDPEDLFYEKYYDIPNPFKRGDILVIKEKLPYTYDSWSFKQDVYYFVKRAEKPDYEADASDIGLNTEYFDQRCGRIFDVDRPINPVLFQYADFDLQNFDYDDPAQLAMAYISILLKGEKGVCMQMIQDACRSLRETNEEKNKIPCYSHKYKIRQPYYGWIPV